MKRFAATLLLSIAAGSALFAENAFWVGNAPFGASWTNEDHYAFTDLYTEGSLLTVTCGEVSINVEVLEKLPKTLENRNFGLTEQVLKELGLWGNGDSKVEVRLRRGSVMEEADVSSFEDSGWYTLCLGKMDGMKALDCCKTLTKKGFKPGLEKDGDYIKVSVKYIVEYEMDEVTKKLEDMGFQVLGAEPSENPYL